LQNFLDLKGPSAATRPSTGVGTGIAAGVGGAAVADFLQNRPSAGQLPARPGAGDRPATADRPGLGDRPGIGDRPGAGNRPGVGDRPGAIDRPGIGDRPIAGQLPDNRPSRIKNREDRLQWRQNRRDEIRDHVKTHHPRWDFWKDHPNWARWRWNRPYRWATWAAVTGWFPWGWSQPVNYSYGDNVYYEGDTVYYGDEAVASAEEYVQQAQDIATSVPETVPADAEWLPLGVFALTQDGQSAGVDPTVFLQLSVSKQGIIAGTVHNAATDETASVEGMVDRKTQRAAWVITGKTSPIMETGIANLTKDDAPALLHFSDGQTQQWLMVRLEEPEGETAPEGGS
jgi:hypothetical protein